MSLRVFSKPSRTRCRSNSLPRNDTSRRASSRGKARRKTAVPIAMPRDAGVPCRMSSPETAPEYRSFGPTYSSAAAALSTASTKRVLSTIPTMCEAIAQSVRSCSAENGWSGACATIAPSGRPRWTIGTAKSQCGGSSVRAGRVLSNAWPATACAARFNATLSAKCPKPARK